MKLQTKVLLLSLGFALLFILAAAFFTDSWPGNGFFLLAGLIAMCGGAGYLILGLVLMLNKNKAFSKGFFISGIILCILGFFFFKFLPGI